MKKRKNLFLIILLVITILIVVIGYTVMYDTYQNFMLRKEVSLLTTLDIKQDRFNKKIVTHGSYATVEKSIKTYLDEYAVNIQKVNDLANEQYFINLLSYDTLKNESSIAYSQSIKYVNENKKTFNKLMNKLIKMCSKDSLEDNIDKAHLNEKYVKLYEELMFNDKTLERLKLSSEYLEQYKVDINNKFDTCLSVYNFLNELKYEEDYTFEDNCIKFKTNELIEKYNSLIQKIKP